MTWQCLNTDYWQKQNTCNSSCKHKLGLVHYNIKVRFSTFREWKLKIMITLSWMQELKALIFFFFGFGHFHSLHANFFNKVSSIDKKIRVFIMCISNTNWQSHSNTYPTKSYKTFWCFSAVRHESVKITQQLFCFQYFFKAKRFDDCKIKNFKSFNLKRFVVMTTRKQHRYDNR